MTDYVTLVEALDFHQDQTNRYGGDEGIRDPGALEAALFRPQTGYYGDLIEEAAALWESMAQNHPFVDGNKRTAFAVTDTFLRINGMVINASPDDAAEFVYSLYEAQTFNITELETWLRRNTESC
jgi:death-on-curing protein